MRSCLLIFILAAAILAARPARAGDDANAYIEPNTGAEFVYVDGGCFEMGCGPWSEPCSDDEKPVHPVCVDGFYMSKHEITVMQFIKFVVETGYVTDAEASGWSFVWTGEDWIKKENINWRNLRFAQASDHPVTCVSIRDAMAFAQWLSEKTGRKFRLPTEAQWEFAARGQGMKIQYPTVNGTISPDMANMAGSQGTDKWSFIGPVGQFPPNGLGLCDMAGNVWEWTLDVYAPDAYSRHFWNNPVNKEGDGFVMRGGGWISLPEDLRCANRGVSRGPTDALGFRLVMEK